MSLTMGEYEDESKQEEKHEHNLVYLGQIGLRVTALGTSLAASCLTFTNKENALVYDVPMDAKYSYSSAFKFFAFATAVASGFALLSLILTLILRWKATLKGNHHFLFFLHDLVMTMLMVGGTAGATAIGYVAKYGNDHAGWVPICDSFHKFCHKATLAIILAFLAFFSFLILTLISAIQSRYHISTAPPS
ncbi:CASP-like protein 1F2 [Silene latifolia]|uniref:CASP-like protein 1F2 n=1 Tax=Silene latifolia TaxID=37657 RepID=UPI003D76ABE6